MVVDDSEFSRKSIIRELEANKFEVVGEASSAQEAIEIFGHKNVNLILI